MLDRTSLSVGVIYYIAISHHKCQFSADDLLNENIKRINNNNQKKHVSVEIKMYVFC